MSSDAAHTADLDILIVGAGFGGLCMLHKARTLGLRAQLIEAADGVGGTWYQNRYPGARVDVQSLEYSYSFDEALQQEWHWTERYAPQPELLRYANHVADRFGLRPHILLRTRLSGARWDDEARCWHASASDGRHWRCQFLVLATGPLSTPNRPDFPGLADFGGPVWHTADWPHEPVDFKGLRVGVIGTGSSGIQVIPAIAPQLRELTVFQRTASYVVPSHNAPLDPAWEARVKADYRGFRARNRGMRGCFGSEHPPGSLSALAVDAQQRQQLFEQRWAIGGLFFMSAFNDLLTDLRANELAAEFVRGKIRAIVRDPVTARKLSPSQPIGCKRVGVDSLGYLETFNRPNVQLVDVNEEPIQRFTHRGIIAGGRERPLDALVLATGFDALTGTLVRLDLRGRGGITIREKWRHGPENFLGLAIHGFPNLFNIAGAGSTAVFTSVIAAIEHHVDWIGDCVQWLRARGARCLEATASAEAAWMAELQAIAGRMVFPHCNSWYLGANIPGKPRQFMMNAGGYPAYVRECAQVAASGYEGFAIAS